MSKSPKLSPADRLARGKIVAELRDEGKKWAEVEEIVLGFVGGKPGSGIPLRADADLYRASLKPTAKAYDPSLAPLAADDVSAILAARRADEGFARIAARAGTTVSAIRKIVAENDPTLLARPYGRFGKSADVPAPTEPAKPKRSATRKPAKRSAKPTA